MDMSGFNWTLSDYLVMAALILGVSSLFAVAAKILPRKYRLPAGVVCVGLFLYLWAELAVGIFTNWGS